MPKRRRHQPGKYKSKSDNDNFRMFNGTKPLAVFQAENGLWGVKDGEGNVVIDSNYIKAQTNNEKNQNIVRLISHNEVLMVTPNDCDILSWIDEDLWYKNE